MCGPWMTRAADFRAEGGGFGGPRAKGTAMIERERDATLGGENEEKGVESRN